jgi:hypothetical protein
MDEWKEHTKKETVKQNGSKPIKTQTRKVKKKDVEKEIMDTNGIRTVMAQNCATR